MGSQVWCALRSACMAALAAAALVGCDPGIDVSGVVRDAAGNPIMGAEVTLTCPDARLDGKTSTNASGHFEVPSKIGCLELECKVSIRAPDGRSKDYMVRDHCKDRKYQCGAACNVVTLDAVL
ncbi:carboxypeptidase-like regulatory domain-containing protein [Sorangium sp. So ce185]|uniref:carboxypeptidase-like regulatory domain-containing protein n=1 Tax=Sorangium sp. So ce185 TaxID=3133287 RepID=UPI003F60D1D8